VWGQNIYVVIIPSILTFLFLGPLTYLHSLSDFNLSPVVTWIVGFCLTVSLKHGMIKSVAGGNLVVEASVALSMAVNAMVTSLIVIRIFKVFRQVNLKDTTDERILGLTGGKKLRSIIFIIIESGMALFAIQLARLVVTVIPTVAAFNSIAIIGCIHQMINVIIKLLCLLLFALLIMWAWLGYNTYNHPGASVNGIVFRRQEIYGRSCREFALRI
jgi:hypothetical protein